MHLHDAANDSAVGEHVEIVVIPTRDDREGAFEDQLLGYIADPGGSCGTIQVLN